MSVMRVERTLSECIATSQFDPEQTSTAQLLAMPSASHAAAPAATTSHVDLRATQGPLSVKGAPICRAFPVQEVSHWRLAGGGRTALSHLQR